MEYNRLSFCSSYDICINVSHALTKTRFLENLPESKGENPSLKNTIFPSEYANNRAWFVNFHVLRARGRDLSDYTAREAFLHFLWNIIVCHSAAKCYVYQHAPRTNQPPVSLFHRRRISIENPLESTGKTLRWRKQHFFSRYANNRARLVNFRVLRSCGRDLNDYNTAGEGFPRARARCRENEARPWSRRAADWSAYCENSREWCWPFVWPSEWRESNSEHERWPGARSILQPCNCLCSGRRVRYYRYRVVSSGISLFSLFLFSLSSFFFFFSLFPADVASDSTLALVCRQADAKETGKRVVSDSGNRRAHPPSN